MPTPIIISSLDKDTLLQNFEINRASTDQTEFNAILKNGGLDIDVLIINDQGAGLAGPVVYTSLTTILNNLNGFTFSAKSKSIDSIIKSLLGFTCIKTGVDQLDEMLFVTGSEDQKTIDLLVSTEVQKMLSLIKGSSFSLSTKQKNSITCLEFKVDRADFNPFEFETVYNGFVSLVEKLAPAQLAAS